MLSPRAVVNSSDMALPESVRLKVLRAKEHYDIFVQDMRGEFQRWASKLVVELDPDFDTSLSTETPIHPRIPLIVGDCLQNLRSALDYLVWELVFAAHGVPGERHAFPVCEKRETFMSASRSRLAGLSEEMLAEIERLQPYHAEDGVRSHPIWLLDKLANVNKHRRMYLVDFGAGWVGKHVDTNQYAIASGPHDQRYVDIQATAYVALNEGEIIQNPRDLSEVVRWLIKETEGRLLNFEKFFAGN